MINQVAMYSATCDHCKNSWYDEHNGWVAMTDKPSMETVLNEEGWISGNTSLKEGVDGEHYCPECFEYDDEDNFILKPERKNNGTAA